MSAKFPRGGGGSRTFLSSKSTGPGEGKRGSSVVRHLPLVLEVPGSIPACGEKNFGVRTRFL